jgi:phthiocerol/phenolphthiocerol synthesis type-I polyketide synthase C
MKNKIAIVGMSFRFPGTDTAQYWPNLMSGRDLVTSVDPDRWTQEAYLHPDKSHQGTSYTFAAGSISDVSLFDADFFGISPREAAQMDPQQRLLLEMSWEALENGGIRPSSLRGSRCGVFIGIASADYAHRFADDLGAIDSQVATGNTSSIAANRISYMYDLKGPSMALDTACSSSLVAFHQACQSIRTGESELAIAGGISLHFHPYGFIAFSKASMLSRQGKCNVFDAAGDGYVRSEGGGIFVLKDYDQALADNDHILAVVAASALNSDGKKNGLTVPSGDAQAALLRTAYGGAGIDAEEIDYIEAHGTGTAVGDPIETRALGEALAKFRRKENPLLIGSVKSNLGHLEAASGIAGLVKAVYCLQQRVVPATIGINNPNPNIHFEDWNLRVVRSATPLKPAGRLIVGVNSFGFGGANAHVILESLTAKVARLEPPKSKPRSELAVPLIISAKTAPALRVAAREMAECLRSHPDAAVYDVAYCAVMRRDWHRHRAVLHGSSREALAHSLDQFANADEPTHGVESGAALDSPVAVAFVYSGNGSQWDGMGRRLLQESPIFDQSVRKVDALFSQYADFSLLDELGGKNGTSRLALTEVAQPLLFAVQVGVTEMLRAQGLMPAAVSGHSVGEIAAAWASGALTLEQAVQVIFHRSKLQGTTQGSGQMTAVAMGGEQATNLLHELALEKTVSIAGVNSARGVTLAGDVFSLDLCESALARRKIAYKRLDLDYAFHSPAMDPIESGLYKALSTFAPHESKLPFVSTVTGDQLSGSLLGAYYWWQNIRNPVLFESAVNSLYDQGCRLFVEIGPSAVLRGYINETVKGKQVPARVLTTLARGDDGPEKIWMTVARAMIAGAPVDLQKSFPQRGKFVPLPTYPWQRERFWQPETSESNHLLQRKKIHPLLGYRLGQQQHSWENQIDLMLQPAMADHVVGGVTVFPGSGYAELALAAAMQFSSADQTPSVIEIEELEIRSPLLLDSEHAKSLRVRIDPADGAVSIAARTQYSEESWVVHAVGRVAKDPQRVLFENETAALPARAADFDGEKHRALTRAVGLDYGPAFSAVESVWVEGDSVWAKLGVPAAIREDFGTYHLHPALLDCAFQLIVRFKRDLDDVDDTLAYVPIKIGRLVYQADTSAPVLVKVTLVKFSPHSLSAHFSLFDEHGRMVAWLRDVRFRSIRLGTDSSDHIRLLSYTATPQPARATLPPAVPHAADELHKLLRQSARRHASDVSLQAYSKQIEPLLDVLCTAFSIETLRRRADETGTLSDQFITAHIDQHPDSAALLEQLIRMLVEHEVLLRVNDGWRFDVGDEVPSTQDIWNALLADHPEHFSLFQAVGRVGLHLGNLLDGTVHVKQVLPQDCSLGAILAGLLGVAGRGMITQAIQTRLASTLAALSEGQKLRMVEISDGAPIFASVLRKSLDRVDRGRCDYLFATPNPETRDAFDNRIERWAGVDVQLFGNQAGTDPPVTDAGARRYQFALLVNDFSSNDVAQRALEHAAGLLAPGGTLAMVGLPSSRWLEMLFGSGQQWEREHSESIERVNGRDADNWRQRINALGFQCRDTVSLLANDATSPYVLVASRDIAAPAVVEETAVAPDCPLWLILANAKTLGTDMVAQLSLAMRNAGAVAVVTELHADGARMSEALKELKDQHPVIAGVICLQEFECPTDLAAAAAVLQQTVTCSAIASALDACERAELRGQFVIVTRDAVAQLLPNRKPAYSILTNAAAWGFGRSILNEATSMSIRLVDIEYPRTGAASNPSIAALAQEILNPDDEQEVIITEAGERFVPRLTVGPRYLAPVIRPSLSTTHRLGFQFPGQLRNLRWESFPRTMPKADEIEIEVAATGLNFRDVMYALGLLSDEAVENGFAGPTLGLECSGVVIAVGAGVEGFGLGDRVVAFGPSSFSNHVTTKAMAVSRIPPGISFEAAATLPSTFFTAYYAIHYLARLREGERILIHGAAGGVGIAAIQLAKWLGAEIFATAGSDDKRDFLRLLGVDHIFDSRSLAFADEILAVTQGEGVDVVLNSLAGEAINRNLRILKPFGRFLELGKRDFYENTKIGLRPFRNNIAYFGIDADQLMQEQPVLTQSLFREVMKLFEDGMLRPLPFHVFEADDVVDAFRYMQQAKQIGKIVITYQDGINAVHTPKPAPASLTLRPDATYLVTGGLGGFGLRTAQWLVEKGARNLVLLSRRGATGTEAETAVTDLAARGIRVWARACDVSDESAMDEVFAEMAAELPPLRGVIHAAAVIEDGLVRNITADQLSRVLTPKIAGAHHLHRLTKSMDMDFLVLYSSATTLFGNPGQASYVAANSYLEALAAARRADGLPALCVRWGAIEDVGFLARNEQIKTALQGRMGGRAIQSDLALALLEELLITDRSDLGVMGLDWKAMSRFLPSARAPKFRELAALAGDAESLAEGADDIQRLLAELSPAELATTIRDLLKHEIGEILRIAPEKIDDGRSVYDMGLDSLMGVELALAIDSRFGIRLPIMTLNENPTITKLADRIIAQLRAGDTAKEAPAAETLTAQVTQLAAQHSIEVDEEAAKQFVEDMQTAETLKPNRVIQR